MRTIAFLLAAVFFAIAVSCAFWELDAWIARRQRDRDAERFRQQKLRGER